MTDEAVPMTHEQTGAFIAEISERGAQVMRMMGFDDPANEHVLRQHMSAEEYAALQERIA